MSNSNAYQDTASASWHRRASPARFAAAARIARRIALVPGILLLAGGLYLALFASPPDFRQMDAVRIMYVHVPAAWSALFVYAGMVASALAYIVWRHMAGAVLIRAAAPVGACMTGVCLITGAIWGQPMWGTWWVWDARLTSVLILFFIYMGIIAIDRAFPDRRRGMEAASWLTVIGAVNLPIIKYSVEWWNTLHQGASISTPARMMDPAIAPAMLAPLLVMAGAFLCLAVWLILLRYENETLRARLDSRRLRRRDA